MAFKDYKEERTDATKWLIWGLSLLVAVSILSFALNSLGLIGKTSVESAVFQHSYQKQHADSDAAKTYKAQLVELEMRLADTTNPQEIAMLKAKMASIRVMLSTKEN